MRPLLSVNVRMALLDADSHIKLALFSNIDYGNMTTVTI